MGHSNRVIVAGGGAAGMMAAIESANGVFNAREIAHASDRLIGIALGAEDYVTKPFSMKILLKKLM